MLYKNEPVLKLKEVVEGEVDKQPQIELDIKYGQSFAKSLRVFNVAHVVRPPYQKQHFHVKNHEQYQVSHRGQHEQ